MALQMFANSIHNTKELLRMERNRSKPRPSPPKKQKKIRGARMTLRPKIPKYNGFKRTLWYKQLLKQCNKRFEFQKSEARDVKSNRYCLFRAVCDQLEGSQKNYRKYRKMAYDHIRAYEDYYRNKFHTADEDLFDEYLQTMGSCEWNGNLEVYALAQTCNLDIIFYDQVPTVIYPQRNLKKNLTTIRISHLLKDDFQHFISVRYKEDNTNEPIYRLLKKDKALDNSRVEQKKKQEKVKGHRNNKRDKSSDKITTIYYNSQDESSDKIKTIYYNSQRQSQSQSSSQSQKENQNDALYQPQEPFPDLALRQRCGCGFRIQYRNCCYKKYKQKLQDK